MYLQRDLGNVKGFLKIFSEIMIFGDSKGDFALRGLESVVQ
jgi:hypothetical protein